MSHTECGAKAPEAPWPGPPTHRPWMAALAGATVLLAACGGGGDGGPAGEPASAEAPAGPVAVAAPAPAPTPVAEAPPPAPEPKDFAVNSPDPAAPLTVESSASVASLPSGRRVAVWTSTPLAAGQLGTRAQTQIVYRLFDSSGQPLGSETVLADSGYAPVVTTTAGLDEFVISWQVNQFTLQADAYAQRFDAAGQETGPRITLGQHFYGLTALPALLADGTLVVATNAVRARIGTNVSTVSHYDRDGLLQRTRVLNEDPLDERESVDAARPLALRGGGYVLAWQRGVRPLPGEDAVAGQKLQVFDAGGEPVAPAQDVPGGPAAPMLLALAGGEFVRLQALPDGGTRCELWQRDARAVTAQRIAGAPLESAAALDAGGFVAAWRAVAQGDAGGYSRQVLAQGFAADCSPTAPAEVVSPLQAFAVPPEQVVDTLATAAAGGSRYLVLAGSYQPATHWDIRGYLR